MPNKYVQYGSDSSFSERKRRNQVHPIWRGIGFLMMFLIPALSYLAALVLLEENKVRHWVMIPREFVFHGADPLMFVKIGLTILIVLVLYSLFTFLGLLIWRVFGPPRYGPLDVPPD